MIFSQSAGFKAGDRMPLHAARYASILQKKNIF